MDPSLTGREFPVSQLLLDSKTAASPQSYMAQKMTFRGKILKLNMTFFKNKKKK
jgi:hypothetical protein